MSAFGVPARVRGALELIPGVDEVYVFGSWAARWHGEPGTRPVGDIEVLVLGRPDRDQVYAALHRVGLDIGREVQVQVRASDWLRDGSGSFHDTVAGRPLVQVIPGDARPRRGERVRRLAGVRMMEDPAPPLPGGGRIASMIDSIAIAELLSADEDRLREVCDRYGVAELAVFGSRARGDATATSDIDLLYTLAPKRHLGFAINQLEDELAEIFGCRVDLVSKASLHRRVREQVLAESQVLYAA